MNSGPLFALIEYGGKSDDWLSAMWESVEREDFQCAMMCQFFFLYYLSEYQECKAALTDDELDYVEWQLDVARFGIPPLPVKEM